MTLRNAGEASALEGCVEGWFSPAKGYMTIAGDGSAFDALLEGVILPALRKVGTVMDAEVEEAVDVFG